MKGAVNRHQFWIISLNISQGISSLVSMYEKQINSLWTQGGVLVYTTKNWPASSSLGMTDTKSTGLQVDLIISDWLVLHQVVLL
jgi:hypothetical protein